RCCVLRKGKSTPRGGSSIAPSRTDRRDHWNRARLLPARVQIALAAGEVELAQSSATELEAIAREYGSTALHASAAQARGAVLLAEGRADEAVPSLRRACKLWQEVQLPYETAIARLLLAEAYRATRCSEDAELDA